MSNHVHSLIKRRKLNVSFTDKSIMLYLADLASDDGSGIWASKTTIAEEMECSRRTVQDAIARLVAAGFLREIGRRDHQRGYTVEYAINLNRVEECENSRVRRENSATKSRGEFPAHVQEAHPTCASGAHLDAQEMHTNHPLTTLEPVLCSVGAGDLGLFDKVLEACGLSPTEIPSNGWMPPAAAIHVNRWLTDLRLTPDEIVQTVRASNQRHGSAPHTPKAFDHAMRALAAAKQAPTMQAAAQAPPGHRQPDFAAERSATLDRVMERALKETLAGGPRK